MTHYAWTIKVKGQPSIQRVTKLADLLDVLQQVQLPGLARPGWGSLHPVRGTIPDHGEFIHNEGADDEWSLTWTRIDDAPD